MASPLRRLLACALSSLGMLAAVGLFTIIPAAQAAPLPPLNLETATGAELEKLLEEKKLTSVELVQLYEARIAALSKAGPGLNVFTQLNPDVMEEAKKADEERAEGKHLGPAMGLPILLKDIIDATPMYTSAGDWALRESFPEKDSGVARNLRAARRDRPRQGRPLGVGQQLRQPALGLLQPHRPGAQCERRGRGPERLLVGLRRRGRCRPCRADDRHGNRRIDHQPLDR